ncbi:HlyD family secretion protein [Thermoflavimicrobium daqui]|uniref:HlyD family secretion protein n=1 Tax=Thermoflavimicrobium daqui TaxID=2137476 RepID=A0A364K3N3_9BACL|nr:HlyD family efflux transporter periplasmic adaptor subunit [Thermoflavimicrobium daqui]RAL23439.1 hypothetical protein DL897_12210 [Thermoflavimicrobium daqui]
MRRWIISVIAAIILLVAVGGGVYYYNQQSQFVTTDNAQVKVDMVPITAQAIGKLKEWPVHLGDKVEKDGVLGTEEIRATSIPGQLPEVTDIPQIKDIISPISGVVLQTNVLPGQIVTPGTPIAMVADLSQAYVIAYIDENEIDDISLNKDVDIMLDAYPDQTFKGKVSEIGKTAGNALAGSGLITNKQDKKEVQRVPVKITFDDFDGEQIKVGLNATVKIHK